MKKIFKIIRKVKNRLFLIFLTIFNKNISIGKNLNYRKNLNLNCAKKGKIIIGNNVFFNNDCSVNAHQLVCIGNDCIFGENVKIYDHNHIFNNPDIKIQKQGFSMKDVVIGENCWIGTNVVILAGSKIGNNVVIGANTVVNGEITSDNIVYQNREYIVKPIKYKTKEGE